MNEILFVGEHPKTYDVRWHSHDNWELVYCTSGQGFFRLKSGEIVNYQSGEVVVIPPMEIHANCSSDGFTNIHITLADPAFSDRTVFRVTDDKDHSLLSAFTQARNYYLSDINRRELVLAALGDLIVSYVVVFRSNTVYSKPVEQIRNSIRGHYADPRFALDQVIRELPFHYDYLRKLFKKEVGSSPLEYLTSLRMQAAEKILTAMWTNEYSISEVAQMCGYEDPLYFSRVFKKTFGSSPTAFVGRQKEKHERDPGRIEFEPKG